MCSRSSNYHSPSGGDVHVVNSMHLLQIAHNGTKHRGSQFLMSKGVLLQCHTARAIDDCNHWILRQTSLLH